MLEKTPSMIRFCPHDLRLKDGFGLNSYLQRQGAKRSDLLSEYHDNDGFLNSEPVEKIIYSLVDNWPNEPQLDELTDGKYVALGPDHFYASLYGRRVHPDEH